MFNAKMLIVQCKNAYQRPSYKKDGSCANPLEDVWIGQPFTSFAPSKCKRAQNFPQQKRHLFQDHPPLLWDLIPPPPWKCTGLFGGLLSLPVQKSRPGTRARQQALEHKWLQTREHHAAREDFVFVLERHVLKGGKLVTTWVLVPFCFFFGGGMGEQRVALGLKRNDPPPRLEF